MNETRPYFRAFDGVRALAILPVLWHHATPRLLPGILGKGAVGVDLFFALSGFLITSLLLAERRGREARGEHGPIDLLRFHERRLSRLLPLYVLVLGIHAVALVATKPDAPQTAHYLRALPAHLTFTSNWFVDFDVPHPVTMAITWSLAVEMQFYVVWSVLFRLVRPRHLLGAALGTLALLDLALEHRWIGAGLPRGGLAFRVLSSLALPILLGALCALLEDSAAGRFAKREHVSQPPRLRSRPPSGASGRERSPNFAEVCSTALLCFLERISAMRCALGRALLRHPLSPAVFLAGAGYCLAQTYTPYVELSLCLALFVWSVAKNEGGVLAPLLTSRPLAHLGRASYAVYLTHLGPLAAVRTLVPITREKPLLLFALTLPLAWLLGEASRRFVEVPARAWLRERLETPSRA